MEEETNKDIPERLQEQLNCSNVECGSKLQRFLYIEYLSNHKHLNILLQCEACGLITSHPFGIDLELEKVANVTKIKKEVSYLG